MAGILRGVKAVEGSTIHVDGAGNASASSSCIISSEGSLLSLQCSYFCTIELITRNTSAIWDNTAYVPTGGLIPLSFQLICPLLIFKLHSSSHLLPVTPCHSKLLFSSLSRVDLMVSWVTNIFRALLQMGPFQSHLILPVWQHLSSVFQEMHSYKSLVTTGFNPHLSLVVLRQIHPQYYLEIIYSFHK